MMMHHHVITEAALLEKVRNRGNQKWLLRCY